MKYYKFKINFSWTRFGFGVFYDEFYMRGENYEPFKSLVFQFAFWSFGGPIV